MQTRRLGFSDLDLTTVGLGTWAIGGPWRWGWGSQDDAESIAAIRRALDLGVNWIDTAPAYGLGHSEEVVGEAIAGRRDEVMSPPSAAFAGMSLLANPTTASRRKASATKRKTACAAWGST